MARAVHPELDDVARGLADSLLGQASQLTDRLVERLVSESETYRHLPPETLAEVRKSCEDNVVSLLRDLAGRRPSRTEAARETARRRAEQGVPLAALLGAYRMGMRVLWEALNDEMANARPAGSAQTLVGLATTMWDLFDAYSGTAATAYDEALVDLARQDERHRTLLLDDLLEGRDPGEQRGQVARSLDLPERGPYVAVAAEVPASGQEGLPRADQLLRRHAIRSAWRLRADDQVGIVALGRDSTAATVRAMLAPAALSRAGVSPPYQELAETARAVAQAALARRTVPAGTVAVATLDDHPLGTLVAGAPEMAARLAQAVLGPVLELPAEERALLLETLAGWTAAGGSASEAARLLYCHRNTVRNRLARLEELTGRQLSDPRGLAELCAAAEAVRLGQTTSASTTSSSAPSSPPAAGSL